MSDLQTLDTADVHIYKVNGKQDQLSNSRNDMLLERNTTRNKENHLLIRPARISDLEKAVEMFNICSNHRVGENEVSVPDVRSEWLLPEFDLESATRIVLTPDEEVIGYVEVWDIDQMPVRIWVWGRVHPAFEGRGIGTRLMNWAENRARQALRRVPADIQVVMESGSESTYEPALDLLRDRGMRHIRSFYTMEIEFDQHPPEPQLPVDLEIRSMNNINELAAVVRAVSDAFRDHWGYVHQPFEQEYERWLHFLENDTEFDPVNWHLAMDGDEIAGVSLCKAKSRSNPNMAWVSTLGVRRPWRRKGVGLALLHYSFGEFYKQGKTGVGLGVDASSLTGATKLYRKAGMKPVKEFNTMAKVLRPGRNVTTQSVE